MTRLRFHLSTAFLLMLIAAVLLWANVRRNPTLQFEQYPFIVQYGWPSRIQFDTFYLDNEEAATSPQLSFIRWGAVVLNGVVASGALFALGCVCEWRIRRREVKAR